MTENNVSETNQNRTLGYEPEELLGFRIGVTSDRRSKDLIEAFERRGASVLHAPTLRMANLQTDEPLIEETKTVIEQAPDLLLATTSHGIRRWLEVADSAGLGVRLLDTLEHTKILVRGPKARGAIISAGLSDAGMSPDETTASLVELVISQYKTPMKVAIQFHGYPEAAQINRLRQAGHTVHTVAPYRWLEQDHSDERVARMIEAICNRQLDCVTFLSAPGVDALLNAAEASGKLTEMLLAFETDVHCAAVGPVTAAPLRALGLNPIQPERYRMGALVRLVCEYLTTAGVEQLQTAHGKIELRGSLVVVAGRQVKLSPAAMTLFRALVRARGAVVSRRALTMTLPHGSDEHAMEVALSRLRRSLGDPGIVTTVFKRGYRINV